MKRRNWHATQLSLHQALLALMRGARRNRETDIARETDTLMNRCRWTALLIGLFVPVITGGGLVCAAEGGVPKEPRMCKPVLKPVPIVELGDAGVFTWACSGAEKQGAGYYVVFIRPSGTYVLLKVPRGRTTYEFTPDSGGVWRWVVINTDPDATKPDVESDPGFFQVIIPEESSSQQ